MKDTLGYFQNQYLNPIYLTTREGIYLQHHRAYSYNQEPIEVPDDFLLLDLGDKNGKISILRLYQGEQLFGATHKNDLKLVNYHMSYSE